MALISRAEAKAVLTRRFNNWWKNGSWDVSTHCGYFYRTTPSSSSFTIDFLCHAKKPSDGTSFNFHLKTKA